MVTSTRGHRTLLRGMPVVIALLATAAALFYTRRQPAFRIEDASLLLGSVLWIVVSVWVASTDAHDTLARRLRAPGGRGPAIVASVAGLLAVLAALGIASPAWLVVLFVITHAAAASRRPALGPVAMLAMVVVTLGWLEASLLLIRHVPALSASPAIRAIGRQLYRSDWSVIHFTPQCAQYDPGVIYTLRPGTCTFENTEFSTRYEINRLGVRDDEASLQSPEIIVTGDSFAMGWGVAQEETYASRLEAETGARVLNAAVSSYGTVRELKLLERVDTSRVRHLIIQYSANDFAENQTYLRNDRVLPIWSPERYQARVAWFEQRRSYRPGKYVLFGFRHFVAAVLARSLAHRGWPAPAPDDFETESSDAEREARRRDEVLGLLGTIATTSLDVSKMDIILFEMTEPWNRRDWFLPALRAGLAQGQGHEALTHVRVVDVQRALTDADHFRLDGHLTASGHEKIARQLLALVRAAPSP